MTLRKRGLRLGGMIGVVVRGVAFTLCLVGAACAQSAHLAPAIIDPVMEGKTLLYLEPAKSGDHVFVSGSKVRIFGGRLWIIGPQGRTAEMELSGTPIGQIASQLRGDFEGCRVWTEYPEYDGRYLDQMGPKAAKWGSPVPVEASSGGSAISARIAGLYSMSGESDGLLSNAGAQLDIVGQQALSFDVMCRLRLALAANNPQAVRQASDSAGAQTPDLETIVASAERVALIGTLDYWITNDSRTKVGISAEYEVAWTDWDEFEYPYAEVGGVRAPISELYPDDRVDAIGDELDQVRPASTILAGGIVRFPETRGLSIHAIASIGWTELFTRKVSYQATQDPDPQTLTAKVSSHMVGIWRGGIGFSLGETLDITTDAIGPLDTTDKDFEPILRILLSKQFPLE